MRILLDACIAREVAEDLARGGHDVARVPAGPGIHDGAVLQSALAAGRVVITADKDFGERVFRRGLRSPGVLRIADVPLRDQGRIVAAVQDQHGEALAEGAFVVVEEDRVRVRTR